MAAPPPPEVLPWWRHLTPAERQRRRQEIRRLRLQAWFRLRGSQIRLALAAYLIFCLLPLLLGQPLLTGFAVLPLLLLPPVAFLAYWLVWEEFHL
ncbi:MAG: hypothetical protein R6W06_03430 [Prochlorococcaceae cyanobacterium]